MVHSYNSYTNILGGYPVIITPQMKLHNVGPIMYKESVITLCFYNNWSRAMVNNGAKIYFSLSLAENCQCYSKKQIDNNNIFYGLFSDRA